MIEFITAIKLIVTAVLIVGGGLFLYRRDAMNKKDKRIRLNDRGVK